MLATDDDQQHFVHLIKNFLTSIIQTDPIQTGLGVGYVGGGHSDVRCGGCGYS